MEFGTNLRIKLVIYYRQLLGKYLFLSGICPTNWLYLSAWVGVMTRCYGKVDVRLFGRSTVRGKQKSR